MNVDSLAIFETHHIRRHFDEKTETWYFSVIDIVAALTGQPNFKKAQTYWTTLKHRLKSEGSEVVTKCDKLKLRSADGKLYKTDVADVETILRIIQSVRSKKAEPMKRWLAKVGYERMQEMTDPEQALNRSREYWQKQGRSAKWIEQRMRGQETRNKLTDYWADNGVEKGDAFAILTNMIHQEWSGLSVKDHKHLKGLKTQNLRDHMSEEELLFTALAELSTRKIAEADGARGLEENKEPARKGGRIAKGAREELEARTGNPVVTGDNYLSSRASRKKLK